MATVNAYSINEERIRLLLETPAYKGLVDKGAAWMKAESGDASDAVNREAAIRFIVMKCNEYFRVDRTGHLGTEERLLDEIQKKVKQGLIFAGTKAAPAQASNPFASKTSSGMKKLLLIALGAFIAIDIIASIIFLILMR
ncbi:MAG: hypothetical protein J6A88_02340 [Oscillospiraceae bacterium]|nr:hypothetical protein [Oscillospiraceae bacterium]